MMEIDILIVYVSGELGELSILLITHYFPSTHKQCQNPLDPCSVRAPLPPHFLRMFRELEKIVGTSRYLHVCPYKGLRSSIRLNGGLTRSASPEGTEVASLTLCT